MRFAYPGRLAYGDAINAKWIFPLYGMMQAALFLGGAILGTARWFIFLFFGGGRMSLQEK
jgi:hypothetical protein